jgi:hypothetical protein
MPSLSNQGARPLPAPATPAAANAHASAPAGRPANAGGKLPGQAFEGDTSVRLSAQALAGTAADAGKSSVDVAQAFMARVADAVFGQAADGAAFSFDSVSLDSSASFSASGRYVSGPNGSSGSASIALTGSAHFVGSGQLTLENGQTYDFDVEVKYEASVAAAGSASVEASPDMILTGKQLPAIKYPGGIEDLFKLLGRELSTEQGDPGKLTLRLMRLVDRAALLAPRLQEDEAPAAARKMAASAYASAGAAEL